MSEDYDEIKRIDIKDFRDAGFLQEVNRQFFHPLGLALEIIIDEEGSYKLGGVWDYREDPEGMFFVDGMISKDKKNHVKSLRESKVSIRRANEYNFKVDDDGIQII
jgi:hypothetical protein